MDPNLVIDDSYVMSARNACVRHGNDLEQILDSYCAILSEIHEEALVDGETSDALELFIACVAKLNDQLSTLSKTIRTTGEAFIQDINTADDYLF